MMLILWVAAQSRNVNSNKSRTVRIGVYQISAVRSVEVVRDEKITPVGELRVGVGIVGEQLARERLRWRHSRHLPGPGFRGGVNDLFGRKRPLWTTGRIQYDVFPSTIRRLRVLRDK